MTIKNKIFIFFLILLILLSGVLCGVLGYYKGFTWGVTEGKERIREEYFETRDQFIIPEELEKQKKINSTAGIVEEIKGNIIFLRVVKSISISEGGEELFIEEKLHNKKPETEILKIEISPETEIVQIIASTEAPEGKRSIATLQDIKEQDRVIVSSREDIRNKKEFSAITIEVIVPWHID